MDKVYRVVITAIDGATETVEVDEKFTGLTLLGDCPEDGKMSEIILHDNIANMAAKLAAGSKTSKAVKLAGCMIDCAKEDADKAEKAILRPIMGDE